MKTAKQGDVVKIACRGRLRDGRVFLSSTANEPLSFKLGSGRVIPGLEQAVVGMAPGQSKTADIAADRAFGQRKEDLRWEVERDQFPTDLTPELGKRVEVQRDDGKTMPATITGISESKVALDGNHPLAGERLILDIELLEIVSAQSAA
jgi:FKBP-type peptidyl-prolyl cis-trans isomerase 2